MGGAIVRDIIGEPQQTIEISTGITGSLKNRKKYWILYRNQ
jgi:hypothetical protein